MVYVVVVLIIIAVIFGAVHSRSSKNKNDSCGSGCSSCAYHSSCSKDEKK